MEFARQLTVGVVIVGGGLIIWGVMMVSLSRMAKWLDRKRDQ